MQESDWLGFLNDALLQLVLVRPDANAVVDRMLLRGGTQQQLPDGYIRLLDINRNLGATGIDVGYVVKVTTKDAIDNSDPNWHNATPVGYIDNYIYDERTPQIFYVSPPVASDSFVFVEASFSKQHDEVTKTDQTLEVLDIFKDPLTSWVLKLAFEVDTDSVNNMAKAQDYERRFYSALGQELQAEALNSPNQRLVMLEGR